MVVAKSYVRHVLATKMFLAKIVMVGGKNIAKIVMVVGKKIARIVMVREKKFAVFVMGVGYDQMD